MVESSYKEQNRSNKPEFTLSRRLTRNIVLRYIFYSILWIILSDFFLTAFINDLELLNTFQTLKGWGFVLVTSSLLYKLIQGSWYQVDNVQNELLASREELTSLFAAMNELIFIFDRQGRYVKIIPTHSQALYRPISKLLNKTICEVFPTKQGEYFYSCILEVLNTQIMKQITYMRKVEGEDRYFEAQISPLSCEEVIWVARDITVQKQAEAEAKNKDQLYRILAHNFPNGSVLLFDLNLRYILTEGKDLESIDLSKEMLEGKTIWEALPADTCEQIEPIYRQALAGKTTIEEIPYAGRIYQIYAIPLTDDAGIINGGMVMTQNITARKEMEKKLEQYAFHDPITNLPNKTALLHRVEELMTDPTRIFAILVIKIENFNKIKYSLGHELAENLLIAIAHRIQECLPSQEEVARVGDKSLGIVIENSQGILEIPKLAQEIYDHINVPIDISGHEILSPIKIGISCNSTNSYLENPQDFLHAADTAMHHSKNEESLNFALFHPSMLENALAYLRLENELRHAINQQQLEVYYQPIILLQTQEIVGFEALIRWQHPTQGFLPPKKFLAIAKETGLIRNIDWWVMKEACHQLKQWQKSWKEAYNLSISINICEPLLSQTSFLEKLQQILVETGIQGHQLKLEVLESIVMENNSTAINTLNLLRDLGIKLSIDDFGTGYSSLERLHQLPIDTLKIDRSFINNMGSSEESLEIIRTIITLAHSLELDIIAEGIETIIQYDKLRSLSCEYGQGYFFSRPISQQQATELLEKQYQSTPE